MSNENQQLQQTNAKLPKIKDLYADIELSKKYNQLNLLLNEPPLKSWLKEHPTAKREVVNEQGIRVRIPCLYLPIARVEYLLTAIFQAWHVEIKEVKQIANAITVTVRLHYWNPVLNIWEYQDGVGATKLNTKSGAGAIDFNQIVPDAVQTGAPAAESYAIKDAAEKIGKLFGKDLNRADDIAYSFLKEKQPVNQ